jgi:hypothetical protein
VGRDDGVFGSERALKRFINCLAINKMCDYESVPTVTQPANLKTMLFRHQLASIYEMERLEREQMIEQADNIKETRLGINGDPTGYGKTLSMIGLICRDKMEWNTDVPFVQEHITTEAAGLVRNREIARYDRLSTTLILVSPSIMSQWEKELIACDLRVQVVATKQDLDRIEVIDSDVVVVSVPMFNSLVISYSRFAWKRFIFDEPGHVRVSGMKGLTAGFYWFVTATPEAITSKHRNCRGSFMRKIIGDGWTKFDEQFSGMILKNDIGFVQASFEMPPTHHYSYKCCHAVLQAVSGIISDTVYNMMVGGDIEGAITTLGGKKTRNIVELVKREKLEEQTKVVADIHIYKHIKTNDKKLEESLRKADRIQQQLDQLESRVAAMLRQTCSICLGKLSKPVLEPCCQNLFCGKCLLTWLRKDTRCPLCRVKIDHSDLVYLEQTGGGVTTACDHTKVLSQVETVKDILTRNKQGKFLIFSSYDATFTPICRFLEEKQITFTQLKGTKKARQRDIDSFKNGSTQVVFLNSNFNGAGLNLQETTDIILYHEMPRSTEDQIVGRANRIGRTKPLRVHHLNVDNI